KEMIPIALHMKMQKEANRFFNINNCIVIPNAIKVKQFKEPRVRKQNLLDELNISKNAFILGHVGRFAKVKNHEFLIKLFVEIKKRMPNAHLILVGTGDLEYQIKKKVKLLGIDKSVSFLGNREDIVE